MTLRFLVDAQLPIALARWLATAGYEAEHVHDLNLADAPDTIIWQEALRLGAVIITKDEDFVVPARRLPHPQVLWVRLGNCTKAALIARVAASIEQIVSGLAEGDRVIELR